jgi:hypothetical protein
MLVIGVPRVILALLYETPLGVEGTLSIICVGLAFAISRRRRVATSSRKKPGRRDDTAEGVSTVAPGAAG